MRYTIIYSCCISLFGYYNGMFHWLAWSYYFIFKHCAYLLVHFFFMFLGYPIRFHVTDALSICMWISCVRQYWYASMTLLSNGILRADYWYLFFFSVFKCSNFEIFSQIFWNYCLNFFFFFFLLYRLTNVFRHYFHWSYARYLHFYISVVFMIFRQRWFFGCIR